MTLQNTGSILATLTQLTQVDRTQALLQRVKTLSVPEFVCLLDFITAEFQQFLRAIDLINNEALETMLERTIEAITLKIGQILQAERTTIFLVNPEKRELWTKIALSESEKPVEVRLPMDFGIPGHVATTGEYLNISDAYKHPLFNPQLDRQTNYYTRNILCMPILSSFEQVVAVAQLSNKTDGTSFNNEDEQTLQDFAASIGIIMESCQSFYGAANKQRSAAVLLEAIKNLGKSLELETTLQTIVNEARGLMQADRCTMFILSKETNELWTLVAAADGKTMLSIRIPANKGIVGYVVSTGQPLNISDAYQDSRFDPTTDKRTGYVTRNILCMPVRNGDADLIGVIQLINKRQGSFTSADEELMDKFNTQAGMALQNAILFGGVKKQEEIQTNIFQVIPYGIISTDKDGKINRINKQARQLLELNDEEKVDGQIISDVVQLLEKENDFSKWFEAALASASETDDRYYYPNQTLITASLAQHKVNLSITVLTDVNNNNAVSGALVTLEDISDRLVNKSTVYPSKPPASTVLHLSGSFEGIARLESLFKAGLLTEVLGISVFDVRYGALKDGVNYP